MDRRTFIKSVGAMAFLNALKVSATSQSDSQSSMHKGGNLLPEVRVILVGSGGWKLLEDHYFRSYTHPALGLEAEQILFIGRTGRLLHGPRPEDQSPLWWDFHSEGEGCERDIDRIVDFKNALKDTRREIARFIQPSDWIVLVASLDNGMAFAACDEVSQLCSAAGAKIIGLVGTPYYGIPEDRARCEILAKASDLVINNMIGNGHPVILDEGGWGGHADRSYTWSWYMQDVALGMISQVSKGQQFDVFAKMVESSSRLNCAFGLGHSAAEAIQEAVDLNGGWGTSLDGKSMTAAGAVIRVAGHPDMVEKLYGEVMTEMQTPDKFKRNGHPYWRKNAQFIVTVEPNAQYDKDMYFYLDVLSTGLEIV